VVNIDAAFGQQFRHFTVGEAETEIPPDGAQDDLRLECRYLNRRGRRLMWSPA
jgi:hypothetical protein